MLVTSLLILVAGPGTAWLFYPAGGADALEERAPFLFHGLVVLKESFDRAYLWYVRKVQQRVAIALNFIDFIGLAGLVVRGTAGAVGLVGMGLRALHVGRVSAYVYWFLAGLAALWLIAALR